MKIGYFGTPFYSVKLLEALYKEGHEISFVVTNLDKPSGRKKVITPSPVKDFAIKHSIPVFQFPTLKTNEAIGTVNSVQTEINIVFAFGSIIPKEIFTHAVSGTINLHTSLLPKYRGASPVESAILSGDQKTGISLQYITEELDAGDIILEKEIPISDNDNGGILLDKLAELGVSEIIALLKKYQGKKFFATPQNHSLATHCKKILSGDRVIDFRKTAIEVFNKIRAYYPYHTAYCQFRNKRFSIMETRLFQGKKIKDSNSPGSLFLVDKKTLVVECGDGEWLELCVLQPENKNQMTVSEFINGYRPVEGERLT